TPCYCLLEFVFRNIVSNGQEWQHFPYFMEGKFYELVLIRFWLAIVTCETPAPPKLSSEDDDGHWKWQFVWSIDFFVAGLLAWSTLIPLLCFPHDIPAVKRKQQTYLFSDNLKDKKFGPGIKDLLAAIWILMKNPVFLCQAVSKATEFLVLIGASEFIPIYLENQFIITPRTAATLTGIILIPGCALGQFLGGVIVSKLQMSCKALMRFIIITSLMTIIFITLIIFVHCHPVQFAGINENYDGTGQLRNLTAPCNENCRCSSSSYSSVCGRDDIEYFSPCFAGCTDSKNINNVKTYYNCSCIKSGLTTPDSEGDFIDAKPGKCDTKCYTLPVFFALIFSAVIFSSFSSVPLTLLIFRTVHEKLHSLALGISYVILRLFGTIPGPFIFKMVGETSCTFRDINKCGQKGRCWIYNRTKMAYILIGIGKWHILSIIKKCICHSFGGWKFKVECCTWCGPSCWVKT
uniref:Solute carrier organic anion transporter family member 6A1 n=1 Tax=Sciurus vulgaris TaxID=55149 RepID=A0A8D2DGA2_SCIVU